MLTATVIGEVASDARTETFMGRDVIAFEVTSRWHGVRRGVTCSMGVCEWSRGMLPDIRKGVMILVTGHYTDGVETGRDGIPRIRRRIRSTTVCLLGGRTDGRGPAEGRRKSDDHGQ